MLWGLLMPAGGPLVHVPLPAPRSDQNRNSCPCLALLLFQHFHMPLAARLLFKCGCPPAFEPKTRPHTCLAMDILSLLDLPRWSICSMVQHSAICFPIFPNRTSSVPSQSIPKRDGTFNKDTATVRELEQSTRQWSHGSMQHLFILVCLTDHHSHKLTDNGRRQPECLQAHPDTFKRTYIPYGFLLIQWCSLLSNLYMSPV